jgi:signal peptidase I
VVRLRSLTRHTLPRARGVGEALLWYTIPALAVAAVLTYLVLAAVWHANPPIVPVTGRSMRPTIHAGDVVFVKGVVPGELRKGDIIAFHTTSTAQKKYGVPATYVHRIWLVQKTSAGYQYRTKGDAVSGPDPFWTPDNAVVGKYAFKVTGIGYPILFFRSRQGMIFILAAIGIGIAYVLMGVFDRRRDEADRNALSLAAMVDEARALRDAMAVTTPEARGPPAPAEEASEGEVPVGPPMAPLEGEAPAGVVLCSRGCHVLLPGARFDPHTGEPVVAPEPALVAPAARDTLTPGRVEPEYVPVWERAQQPHLAEFELAPAYREDAEQEPEPPAAEPEPARVVGAYVAGEIDFERLEREIHDAVRSSSDVKETMRELVGAIGEYGEHLQSHTAVMRGLAAATGDLQATTAEMREFLAGLTSLLRSLVEQQRGPQA